MEEVVFFTATAASATAAGFLVLLMPAGIGVREVVMIHLLAPRYGLGAVVLVSLLLISTLKVFDIVFVQPANAEVNGTVVIAERMIRWFFLLDHNGRGAAIAVVLFFAVIPVMIWNVRTAEASCRARNGVMATSLDSVTLICSWVARKAICSGKYPPVRCSWFKAEPIGKAPPSALYFPKMPPGCTSNAARYRRRPTFSTFFALPMRPEIVGLAFS